MAIIVSGAGRIKEIKGALKINGSGNYLTTIILSFKGRPRPSGDTPEYEIQVKVLSTHNLIEYLKPEQLAIISGGELQSFNGTNSLFCFEEGFGVVEEPK